jgi:hypothetical protein
MEAELLDSAIRARWLEHANKFDQHGRNDPSIQYCGMPVLRPMSTRHILEIIAAGALVGVLLGPVIALMVFELGDGDSGF